jgi:alpha-tubulin suppressor-like RCC1 family protein
MSYARAVRQLLRLSPVVLLAAVSACGVDSLPAPPPSKLAFTVQPTTATAGVSVSPAVVLTVQDASGNTVRTANTSITVALGSNPAGGTLSGAATVAAVSGLATFANLVLDKAGTGYTLTATASGLTGATSNAFTVTPGPANKLIFAVQPSNVAVGAAIGPAVAVAVQDTWGNTVLEPSTSITVAIGTNPAGGTLAGTTTVAAASGVAIFSNLTLDRAGAGYTLTGAASGVTGATSAAFNVTGFVSISAGASHTCGVRIVGSSAYCWGLNDDGELGDGSTTGPEQCSGHSCTMKPALLPLGLATVRAGSYHTCGLTTAGLAYCWGWNMTGQLGNGSTTASRVPVPVSGGLTFAAVGAGVDHSCGLTPGGAVYCWGYNGYAELGNGSMTGPQLCHGLPCSTVPVGVLGELTFAAASAGDFHTCGLTTQGSAYCWGWNAYGQLGNGVSGLQVYGTTPVAVSGGLTFAIVSAGGQHTCALTIGGAAYCWGWNSLGELGSGGTTDNSPMPVLVSGGLTFAAVSAGAYHTCGLTTASLAYCWGSNDFGELGNGSTIFSPVPVLVSGGLTFTALSTGSWHTCGLTTGGAAYCWGLNSYGQLGNGSTTNSTTPARVANQ